MCSRADLCSSKAAAHDVQVADFGLSKSLPKLGLASSKSIDDAVSESMNVDKYTLTGGVQSGSGGEVYVLVKQACACASYCTKTQACCGTHHFGCFTTAKQSHLYLFAGETGSYRYMAPEVFLHEPYNTKVDVYSFAMICFQLFEGRMPFEGCDAVQAAKNAAMHRQRPTFSPEPLHSPNAEIKQVWLLTARRLLVANFGNNRKHRVQHPSRPSCRVAPTGVHELRLHVVHELRLHGTRRQGGLCRACAVSSSAAGSTRSTLGQTF
jgi:serine/threonine protein kinase